MVRVSVRMGGRALSSRSIDTFENVLLLFLAPRVRSYLVHGLYTGNARTFLPHYLLDVRVSRVHHLCRGPPDVR